MKFMKKSKEITPNCSFSLLDINMSCMVESVYNIVLFLIAAELFSAIITSKVSYM